MSFDHLAVAGWRRIGGGRGPTDQKLRGGYYTPAPIANFLAAWAVTDSTGKVLEPSAGDGECVAAAIDRLPTGGSLTAVEVDADEADKAQLRGGPRSTVIAADFFTWFAFHQPVASFDAALGNPPFIRFHDFPEQHREPAFRLMRQEGLHPSRLTNAWVPFVVACTRALRPGGRLALVLPAELLQVSYAAELREYLVRNYESLTVVTFRRLRGCPANY